MVRITYDPAKRAATLRDRDIDFESAGEVFDGVVTDIRDERFDYGEIRAMTVGHLRGANGDCGLDSAGRRAPRHIDEEGQ